jgi:hypothetical protein
MVNAAVVWQRRGSATNGCTSSRIGSDRNAILTLKTEAEILSLALISSHHRRSPQFRRDQ